MATYPDLFHLYRMSKEFTGNSCNYVIPYYHPGSPAISICGDVLCPPEKERIRKKEYGAVKNEFFTALPRG